MAVKKSEKKFIDVARQRMATSSRLNVYNMLRLTETNQHFMNIFRSFGISDSVKNDNKYFTVYLALEDEWWDNISFNHYGSSNYWYMLCELNSVVNPYEELEVGQVIKVLKQAYLYELFKGMPEIAKL